MGTNDSPAGWLLLLAQLPSTPSRIRVALWRQLRAAGKQLAAPARQQILEFKARTPVLHTDTVLNAQWGPLTNAQRCMV